MTVLYHSPLFSTIHEYLRKSDESETIFLFVPYVQSEMLKKLLGGVKNKVVLVTTWRPRDIQFGSSDLSLYTFCKKHNIDLYIHETMHLKVYSVGLSSAILATGNISEKGLEGNYEAGTMIKPLTNKDRLFFEKIRAGSRWVDNKMHEEFEKWYKNSADLPEETLLSDIIPKPTRDRFLMSVLPMTKSIEDLTSGYLRICAGKPPSDDPETAACVFHDLANFGIEPGMSESKFRQKLSSRFFEHSFIQRISKFITPEPDFEGIKAWIDNNCTRVHVPSSRTLDGNVQVLLEWFAALGGNKHGADAPVARPQQIKSVEAGHDMRQSKTKQGEPWRAFVAVERLRHKCSRGLGWSGSAKPLPHQLQTIYQVSGETGRIRYMIADEPGGGKTVVAIRIMQELFIQNRVSRVLIVVPAMLKLQWKDELKKFGNMESHVIDSKARNANPWRDDKEPILITSMDYAKRNNQKRRLKKAKFDLVIVDEAHNFNATASKANSRYRLGELLGDISEHMIFLTATPHRGKEENFRRLLTLLEPKLFNTKMTPEEVYHRKNRIFIRHAKSDMVKMDGKPLFLERSVKSVEYDMTESELEMYNKVTKYVRNQYNLRQSTSKISAFAVLIIQKRMASSTYALLESLKRRQQKLEERLKKWDKPMRDYGINYYEANDRSAVDDDDQDKVDGDDPYGMEEKATGYTSADTADKLKDELGELAGLIKLAEGAIETKQDRKLEKLKSEIEGIGNDKLLIFSEYRDTIQYLEDNIVKMRRQDGDRYEICRIDGTMKMADREAAQERFHTSPQIIMLATDAAREGINLQSCHRMINYDLPWTPISLEQRMGRLHRYGQKHDVTISNMVAVKTIEGHVMKVLFEKICEIEKQYKTFNVVGQVLTGGDLRGLMTDAILDKSTEEDMTKKVEKTAHSAEEVVKKLGHTSMDEKYVKDRVELVEAQRIDGEYLVQMVKRLFDGLHGIIKYEDGKTTLNVPKPIQYGPLKQSRVLHDGPPEELLFRGGPIYHHLEEWVEKHCSGDLQSGSVFRDPGGFDGYVVFHTISIRNKNQDEIVRLLTAHKYAGGTITDADPYILHGMKYGDGEKAGPAPPMNKVEKAVLKKAHDEANRVAHEREKTWELQMARTVERTATEIKHIQALHNNAPQKKGSTRFGPPLWYPKLREQQKYHKEEMDAKLKMTTIPNPQAPKLEGWVRVVPDLGKSCDVRDDESMDVDASMAHERDKGPLAKIGKGT